MEVLVTGSGGFLGGYINEFLIENNHEVVGLVHNVNKPVNSEVTLINVDITEKNELKNIKNYNFDAVIHNAAHVNFNENTKTLKELIDVNVNGTLNVLNFCVENNVKNIFYSSSVSVYEETTGLISEKNDCNPITFYGMSKLMGELLCKKYQREYNVNCCIFRYGGIYGYGSRHNISIMNFIYNVLNKKEINLFHENSLRNYIYVKDVAFANVFALENELAGLFNIVSDENMKLIEMVDIVCDVFKEYEPRINYSHDNIDNTVLYDSQKFISICKDFPKYSFEDAIKDIKHRIDSFEKIR